MKKLKSFLFGASVLAIASMTSCTKDNTAPVISDFKITGDQTKGGTVTISATLTDGEELAKADLAITLPNGGQVKSDSKELSGTSGTYSYDFVVPQDAPDGQVYNVELVLTDDHKNDVLTDTETGTITIDNPGGAIHTYQARLMGSTGSAHGSFYSVSKDSVYFASASAANHTDIDFVFYSSGTVRGSIGSPADTDFKTTYFPTNLSDANFPVRNNTKFIKTTAITATGFDAITDDTEIVAAASNATATKVEDLDVADVVAFKTNDGKSGIFRVTDLNGLKTDGDIKIEVKVQQ